MKKIINLYKSRSKNFWVLEFSFALHFMALSISSIFIPILLLKIGFSLKEVILYYILLHGLNIIFNFFSKKFIVKFGLKKSLILGTVLMIGFFTSYLFLENENWIILILMAVLAAAYDAIYYISYFFGIMDSTKKIENIKYNNIITDVFASTSFFIGPLLGAFIILFSENKNLILFSTIFVFILSLIPLLYYKKNHEILDRKIDFKKLLKNTNRKRNLINLFFYKISESAENILWPIFIFTIYEELDSIAYLSIVIVFTSLFFTYLSGNITKENRKKEIIFGSLLLLFMWIGRYFIEYEIFLYISSIFAGIFILFIRMPINANIYRRGTINSPILSAFYKNIVGMFAKFLFFISIFIILHFWEIKSNFILVIILLSIVVISNLYNLKDKSAILE